MSTLLIAGTRAQVGKSTLAAALAAYWQIYFTKRSTGASKLALERFTPGDSVGLGSTGWLDLAQAWQKLTHLSSRTVLMELPGGLGTPLTPEATVADLAWDWRLPTVLVVPVTSDMMEQAIAHAALAHQARVHLKGIVLNHISPPLPDDVSNSSWNSSLGAAVALMQSFTQAPVLGQLPYLSDTEDANALAAAASHLDLERLFPLSMLMTAS
ncbi:MAG: AAA family ATPase [Elainellaceae cyanobacterium]